MSLTGDKCSLTTVGTSELPSVLVEGHLITASTQIDLLGFPIDCKLSWVLQALSTAQRGAAIARLVVLAWAVTSLSHPILDGGMQVIAHAAAEARSGSRRTTSPHAW